MKKIYSAVFVLSILHVSLALYAQSLPPSKIISSAIVKPEPGIQHRAGGDTIGLVIDFTNSTDWVIDNSGAPGGGWVIDNLPPDGPYSGGMGLINSTSGGNFALFDADGIVGEAFMTMANPVDLSGFSNVAFQFESYYLNFQGDAYFEISTDGIGWTSFPVHSALIENEFTANPELVSVNITAIAAFQSTVWARFRYVSTDDFAWMIDDVSFVEGFSDNLILTETFLASGIHQYDYYMIPISQIQEFTFGASVSNGGSNIQNTTTLNVIVNDGTSDVYNQSSTPISIPVYGADTLELITTSWIPTAGTYTTSYTVFSSATDETPIDNGIVLEDIIVGGNVYARDNGIVTGSIGFLGTGLPTIPPTVMGNYFDFAGDFSMSKIQIGIGSTSLVGDLIYGEVRIWDGFNFISLSVTPDYFLTAGDIGNIVTLALNTPINCQAGEHYFVGAGHYGSNATFQTAQIANGGVVYDDGDDSLQNRVFIIRPQEVYADIEEKITVQDFSFYPNPANDFVTLNYTLTNEACVTLTMTDLAGKIVMKSNFGNQTEGFRSLNLTTSSLANGIYFYTLTVDDYATTIKITIANN